MKRAAKLGCLTPLALFIAIAGLFAWSESAMTIRYRLTLFVDDNGQTVTGSSVYETVWGGGFGLPVHLCMRQSAMASHHTRRGARC
jgi:hypothetical protein